MSQHPFRVLPDQSAEIARLQGELILARTERDVLTEERDDARRNYRVAAAELENAGREIAQLEQRLSVLQPTEQNPRVIALKEAQQAIVEACTMCGGDGFTVEVTTGSRAEHHPDCDGSCSLGFCPVAVETQEQTQERCEYCGRLVDAIQALEAVRRSVIPSVTGEEEKTFTRSDHPSVSSGPDQRGDVKARSGL